MSKKWTIFVVGILVFFIPFFGFPPFWEHIFLFTTGIVLVVVALTTRFTVSTLSEQENEHTSTQQ